MCARTDTAGMRVCLPLLRVLHNVGYIVIFRCVYTRNRSRRISSKHTYIHKMYITSIHKSLSLVFHKSPDDEIRLNLYLKDRRSERGVELGLSQVTHDEIQLDTYLKDRRSDDEIRLDLHLKNRRSEREVELGFTSHQ